MNDICFSVQKVQGGYILSLPDGMRVETSLDKVLNIAANVLGQELPKPITDLSSNYWNLG